MINIAKRENYKKEIEALNDAEKKEMYEWIYKFDNEHLYIPTNKVLQELCIKMIVDWAYSSFYYPLHR